jgi:hypothetical protein
MGAITSGNVTSIGSTLVTVPPFSTWSGHLTLSAAVTVAPNGAAITAHARISVVGVGATPPPGDYLRIDLHAPASIVGAVGTSANGNNYTPFTVSADANPVTLVLNGAGTTMQSALANGGLR